MYQVLGALNSRTLRVVWMLEELGQPYQLHPHKPHSPEILAHNPNGKIPVLLSDEGAITDSTAILTYLTDRHGAFSAPPATLARARQDGWTFQILDEIDSLIWMAARHTFVLPPEMRLPAIKDSLKAEFVRNQKTLAKQLSQSPYLMGDAPSLPDFLLVHCLGWAQSARFPTPLPPLQALRERMEARPAFARAMAATGVEPAM